MSNQPIDEEVRQEDGRVVEIRSADPAGDRDTARETAKSAALLLIMLLLILLLIAAATGRTDILPIAGVQTTQTLRPYLSTATGDIGLDVYIPTPMPGPPPPIDEAFLPYYNHLRSLGDECSIGDAISRAYSSQGLRYQWFQRAVLKEMPAGFVDDPSWAIQGEPLGREVTTAIPFPTTSPFLSQPNAHNFGETGYSVSGPFLDFWVKCDGLHVLGYPISDVVSEVLVPNTRQIYQVQYFERGRLEYHQDDPSRPVQFGLLGLIKSKDRNFKPNIVMPPQPGGVVPVAATPTVRPTATSAPQPAATALPAAPTSTAVPAPVAPTVAGYPAP